MLDLQALRRFMVNSWERGWRLMAESESDGDALARLESALDRIARRAHLLADPSASPAALSIPDLPVDTIADRLDVLIGQIRRALDSGAPAIED